ncbi:MAG TPA: pilus assembly protein TadG-related protein [Gemmatimonadales bacterium]|nr:pilus assembly protein TadG-related protein [Gemmatimonadales bacterium]
MRRRFRRTRNERGQSLPLVAVAIFTMLGLSAIAIDLGMLYSAQTEAQRAADASALAGAGQYMFIPDPNAAVPFVDSAARDFAKLNSIQHVQVSDPDIVSVVPVPDSLLVHVVIQRAGIRNWFASTIGFSSSTVNAAATAQASPSGKVQCLKPIAIPDMWSEPGPGQGADTLVPNGVSNKVWDIPGPPASGNGYPSPPNDFIEAWHYTGAAGQSYGQTVNGYGTGYRNGQVGTYQTAKINDFGRRLVLMIESPGNGNPGPSIQPSSFYQAWATDGSPGGGNGPGGTSAASVAAGIGASCGLSEASVNQSYPAANGIGAGPIGNAWDDLYSEDPNATWDDQNNQVVGSNKCPATGTCTEDDWMQSPRVITVAVYDPAVYATAPNANDLTFNNFATVFVEKPFTVANGGGGNGGGRGNGGGGNGGGGNPKRWVTGIFLHFTKGVGAGNGGTNGSLVKTIRLIR